MEISRICSYKVDLYSPDDEGDWKVDQRMLSYGTYLCNLCRIASPVEVRVCGEGCRCGCLQSGEQRVEGCCHCGDCADYGSCVCGALEQPPPGRQRRGL